MMNHESVTPWRPDSASYEDLLDVINTLATELATAAETTGSGHAPIAARADYLRAQAAHDDAVATWTAGSAQHQVAAVRDALGQCRAALEAACDRLRP